MAARKKKEISINLLPQEEFAASTTGRVLAWLLSTFRYLVITTEMVVISAFISRFYFDSKVADLNEEIKQKQEYINAFLPFEYEFKDTQKKLSIVDNMTQSNKTLSPILTKVVEKLPADVQLFQLSVSKGNKVSILGSSLSEQSIEQLIVNLSSDTFLNVSLTQVDTKANTPFVNFTINASVGNKEGGTN